MSTLEAPPAPSPDRPEPHEPSSSSVAPRFRVAQVGRGAAPVPSEQPFVRRLVFGSARLAGRSAWMVLRWTLTIALVGSAVAVAGVVTARSAHQLVRNSSPAVPS